MSLYNNSKISLVCMSAADEPFALIRGERG